MTPSASVLSEVAERPVDPNDVEVQGVFQEPADRAMPSNPTFPVPHPQGGGRGRAEEDAPVALGEFCASLMKDNAVLRDRCLRRVALGDSQRTSAHVGSAGTLPGSTQGTGGRGFGYSEGSGHARRIPPSPRRRPPARPQPGPMPHHPQDLGAGAQAPPPQSPHRALSFAPTPQQPAPEDDASAFYYPQYPNTNPFRPGNPFDPRFTNSRDAQANQQFWQEAADRATVPQAVPRPGPSGPQPNDRARRIPQQLMKFAPENASRLPAKELASLVAAMQELATAEEEDEPVKLPSSFTKGLKVSTFEGGPKDDVRGFLGEFESFCRSTGTPEKAWVAGIEGFLKSGALRWYQSLGKAEKSSYRVMKGEMLKEFAAQQTRDARAKIKTMTFDPTRTTVAEFTHELKAAVAQAHPEADREQLDQITCNRLIEAAPIGIKMLAAPVLNSTSLEEVKNAFTGAAACYNSHPDTKSRKHAFTTLFRYSGDGLEVERDYEGTPEGASRRVGVHTAVVGKPVVDNALQELKGPHDPRGNSNES